MPAPAVHAEGLFQAIVGSLTGWDTRSYRRGGHRYRSYGRGNRYRVHRRSYRYASRDRDEDDTEISERRRERTGRRAGRNGDRRSSRPTTRHAERPVDDDRVGSTFCVRLCDGRHFPAPSQPDGVALNAGQVCSSLCPAAKTQVFQGTGPDDAVAHDGTRYTDLVHAFAYRARIVPNCSCTGSGSGGLARIDIQADHTLRAGDIVATTKGLTVFRGARNIPHKAADFARFDNSRHVDVRLRRRLAAVKVDPTAMSPSRPALAAFDGDVRIPMPRRRPQAETVRRQAQSEALASP